MTKLNNEFVAEIHPDRARVIRRYPKDRNRPNDRTEVELGKGAISAKGPADVVFQNVDYKITLKINGKTVVEAAYDPDLADLWQRERDRFAGNGGRSTQQIRDLFPQPQVSISAAKQACTVSHLSLWRDIYYLSAQRDVIRATISNPVHLHRAGERDDSGHVCDDEFFVLGDNSALSADARMWTGRDGESLHLSGAVDLIEDESLWAEPGRVPGRFLMGKAFFVYWPAGYRLFFPTAPDAIPNFGKMRFIH